MKRIILCCFMLTAFAFTSSAQYKVTQEHKDRAAEVVKKMTLEEKIDYIGGHASWYVRAIDRLGLPAVRMADGPQGVRNNTKSTLYPSGIAAAATWDIDLIEQMGVSLGKDSRARGVHILLGPGANIYRSPLCGRNFEYFGEDPFLAGEIATAYIKGVQSMGVMACIKHFAGNNQEWARHSVSTDVDERTLNEIYFPAFEKAVKKGNVATIMTSYNLLNGVHASEDKYLNQDVLRGQWNFGGFVMSDWTSCYSPVNVARWGVDLEMPYAKCLKPELIKKLVEQGVIDERALDQKCQNIIQTIFAFEFDKREQLDKSLPENNPECDAVAHKLSQSAVVMLKNDGFLPFKKGKVVVCGDNADKIVTGGGSGFVTPLLSCSVAEAMQSIDKKIKSTFVSKTANRKPLPGVVYADKEMTKVGVAAEYYTNAELEGKPAHSFITDKVGIDENKFGAHNDMVNVSTRHTFYYKPAVDECYHFYVNTNDGYRCYINDKMVMRNRWHKNSSQEGYMLLEMKAGQLYKFELQHQNLGGSIYAEMAFESPMVEALADAEVYKNADCIVVCLGHNNRTEKENHDRTFELPRGQVDYLKEILKHNKNVVVVLNGGGAIEMASWMNDVKAVLMAWYPGQQGGLAISEIITGKISPSGKLPISIETKLEDNPCSANYHENVDRVRSHDINPHARVEYREGIFMGYRGYEKNGVKPLFPFGFGLSYTTFEYSNLEIKAEGDKEFVVSFDVKNTGKVAGAEVAQVYVGDDVCSLVRPAKELKGFDKVYLKAGETKRVSIRLDEEAFRFFDPIERKFKVELGSFTVYVGSSSADIRLKDHLVVLR